MERQKVQDQHPRQVVQTLLIGALVSARRAGKSITLASSLSSSPILHDFGVVVVRYSNSTFQRTPKEKWREWGQFLRSGGIAIVLGIDPSVQRYSNRLVNKALPRLTEQIGHRVLWVRGSRFFSVLHAFQRAPYEVTVPRAEEHLVTVIGRNAGGDSVAFEVVEGRGLVLFLPWFEGPVIERVVLSLAKEASKQYISNATSRAAPDWASSIRLGAETQIQSEVEVLSNRLKQLGSAKAILWQEGKPLSRECARILVEVLGPEGYDVRWEEEGGAHDIKVEGISTTILTEVRASGGAIDVEVARQLLDHMQLAAPTTATVKGLIIGNPHRNTPASRRSEPFTPTCENLAERNGFCLMTTAQLLSIYDGFVSKTLAGRDLVARLLATTGLLDLPGTF